jgi:hypothetical protein
MDDSCYGSFSASEDKDHDEHHYYMQQNLGFSPLIV